MPVVQKEFQILNFDTFKMMGIHDFKDLILIPLSFHNPANIYIMNTHILENVESVMYS
jgi:hypothetical protein